MSNEREITTGSILCQSDDLLSSDLGTEKLMMSMERGRYFGVNEVGKIIHDRCDGKTTLGKIVDELVSEFEIGRQECEATVLQFSSQLVSEGLLRFPEP